MLRSHISCKTLWLLPACQWLRHTCPPEQALPPDNSSFLCCLSNSTAQGWVFRDLKLGNVTLDTSLRQVSIIDTGGMVRYGTPSFAGTYGYCAPELFTHVMHNGVLMYAKDVTGCQVLQDAVTDKLDVWAGGITVLHWHLNQLPLKLQDPEDFEAILSFTVEDLEEFLREHVANEPELSEFLRGTLHPDPAQRWTALQAIQHSFLNRAASKVGCAAT